MSDLAKKSTSELVKQLDGDGIIKAEAFIQKFIAVDPLPEEVKINDKIKEKPKFIPISMIEDKLDELFFGAWETKDFQYTTVANEIIGSIQLRFFHPVFQVWMERTGCASVMVQMKSIDNGGDGTITNIENKIKNTLVKDFPHLKAECIKNAAKSIGRWFGRDLNRKLDMQGEYTPIIQNEINKIEEQTYQEQLIQCNTLDDVLLLWRDLTPVEQSELRIKKLFTARKAEIKANIQK